MPVDPELPDLPAPSVTDAVVLGAIVAQATEAHAPHGPTHTHCENCGIELKGPFCHQCGQHDFEFHRSFGHVFFDALENFFHFDAKFFRNIVTLLFRPGQLTAEFNSGKRAAQMPPFRLYLFVSVLFFFISFIGKSGEKALQSANNPTVIAGSPEARAAFDTAMKEIKQDAVAAKAAKTDAKTVQRRVKTPAGIDLTLDEKTNTPLERLITEKGRYAFEHQAEMVDAFTHALPRMLLVCLPFFALYTRFLFRKSGQVYLQHLVIAVHFHTFIFLWRLCADGWVFLLNFVAHPLAVLVGVAANLWLFGYVFLMLRRLFANSWKLTIFKTGVLAGLYGLTLGLGFMITAITIFFLL